MSKMYSIAVKEVLPPAAGTASVRAEHDVGGMDGWIRYSHLNKIIIRLSYFQYERWPAGAAQFGLL